jgi:hypothetical protein
MTPHPTTRRKPNPNILATLLEKFGRGGLAMQADLM